MKIEIRTKGPRAAESCRVWFTKNTYMRTLSSVAALTVALVASTAGCAGNGGTNSVAPPISGPANIAGPLAAAPTPTPIQLKYGTTIGTLTWPDDDTATGGQGQQIDGINCRQELLNTFHHHAHLSIFVNGTQRAIPKGTGMFHPGSGSSGFIYHAQCFYFLHTHDQTGIIHIEPPAATVFTLGQWFDLWGEPLNTGQIANFQGQVSVYVNGVLQPSVNPRKVAFSPHEEITLVIGTPPAWIPQYIFPAGYP
jgi:hypothetical protein